MNSLVPVGKGDVRSCFFRIWIMIMIHKFNWSMATDYKEKLWCQACWTLLMVWLLAVRIRGSHLPRWATRSPSHQRWTNASYLCICICICVCICVFICICVFAEMSEEIPEPPKMDTFFIMDMMRSFLFWFWITTFMTQSLTWVISNWLKKDPLSNWAGIVCSLHSPPKKNLSEGSIPALRHTFNSPKISMLTVALEIQPGIVGNRMTHFNICDIPQQRQQLLLYCCC